MIINFLIGVAEIIITISIILIFVLFLWIYNVSVDLKELDKNISNTIKELETNGNSILSLINEINNRSKPHISYALLIPNIKLEDIRINLNKYNNSIKLIEDKLDLLYTELQLQLNDTDNEKLYNSLKECCSNHFCIINRYNTMANKLNIRLYTFPNNILGKILKIHTKEEVE